jgi:ATP-dependent DNA helicase UvrD/PcrA
LALDLDSLNEKQRAAVEHLDGPLLVLAGAGSGKTRTLTYRIANLLDQGRASPHSILAITFTRKAAGELAHRLETLVGEKAKDITATTFHGLGYRLLRAEGAVFGLKPESLSVLDGGDARRLLKQAMKDVEVDGERWDLEVVAAAIERAKDELRGPDRFVTTPGDFFEESIAKVYRRYQELLKENNAVDYGDLIRLSVQLLQEKEASLAFYQNLFRYISVDELQDTSDAQYELIRYLVWKHQNLCGVGSPVQAIYSWRGGNIANILTRFQQDFPTAPTIVLDQNYRSTQIILEAANSIVTSLDLKDKEMWTQNEAGDKITLVPLNSDRDEAAFIAAEAERLVAQEGLQFADCAVLFRTRAQGRLFEQVLMQRHVPYTLVGDFRFFERREIKDILAYLRASHNSEDAAALQRIINRPPRGLGTAALLKLQQGEPELNFFCLTGLESRDDLPPKVKESAIAFADLLFTDLYSAARDRSLPGFVSLLLERTGYQQWIARDPDWKQRLANLRALYQMTTRYADWGAEGLGQFLADTATLAESDVAEGERGVVLITVHAAKGLEFPVIFLAGMEESIFPHIKSLKTPAQLEEERRVAYVAITRAMKHLYLTYARSRLLWGDMRENAPSRFLADIPAQLIERRTPSGGGEATISPAIPKAEVAYAES